ncbi:MAG: hypothetical protein JJE50_12595 [Actinomycetales bacterium]|nr:hypothetical protein [Actinomycetales bacterium]
MIRRQRCSLTPGPHRAVGIGASSPTRRFRPVELAEQVERTATHPGLSVAKSTLGQPAVIGWLQAVGSIEQAVEHRAAVAWREDPGTRR